MSTICPFIPQGRGVCTKDFRGVLRQDRSDPGSGDLRKGVSVPGRSQSVCQRAEKARRKGRLAHLRT